jgi:acyl carrier protein
MDRHQFDTDASYTEFGVDSILAIEIINRLNEKLAIQLRTTDLFNYPTIRQLVDHIVDEFGHAIDSKVGMNLTSSDELFNMQPEDHTKLNNDEGEILEHPQEKDMLKILELLEQNKLDIYQADQLLGEEV